MRRHIRLFLMMVSVLLAIVGCEDSLENTSGDDETFGRVVRVYDGDTIQVEIDGDRYDVRYIGVNTPERGDICYDEATNANDSLVAGETVRLVRDESDTDQFDRLLRYVYVGDTFVNARLVERGYAEAVRYPPDLAHYDQFVDLENRAAADNRGCHPTGIFDDGSQTR